MNHAKVSGRALLLLAALTALLVTTLMIAGLGLHALMLSILIMVTLLPMGVRYLHGRLDLFEPLVLANLSLGVMFIGRPLADLASGTTMHLGLDITATFDKALLLVIVATLFFQLGYHSPFSSKLARALRKPAVFRKKTAVLAAWLFFLLGGLLFGLFLAKGGGLGMLFVLLSGRGSGDNAIFLGSTGYFYNGILMWAASALIFFAIATALERRKYFIGFVAMALPLVIFFGARGTRSQLLPLVLAVPTFWFLWKKRRPSARALLLAALLGTVLIGWQRETRTADTSDRDDAFGALITAVVSPVQQFGDILNGADNEMFDSIANELQVVPDEIAFRPAGSLTDLLIRAAPRLLWPDKPLETNDAVVNALWPAHYASSRASAAFSIVGPFYADGGFISVALGMFGIGVVLAAMWRWYLQHGNNLNATLIYSMGLPFVVILMRGTLPDTLSRMLFMVVPLVLAMWASRFRLGGLAAEHSSHESSS